jgi:DNA polymerase III subunit epsilon
MNARAQLIAIAALAALIGALASLAVLVQADRSGDLRETLATSRPVQGAAALGIACALALLVLLVRWFLTSALPWLLAWVALLIATPAGGYYLWLIYPDTPTRVAILAGGIVFVCLWLWVGTGVTIDWRAGREVRDEVATVHERAGATTIPDQASSTVSAHLLRPSSSGTSPSAPASTTGDAATSPTLSELPQLRWKGQESRDDRRRRDYAHAKARESARRFMRRDDWLVIDTETTGLGESDEIIGIVAVDPTGAQVFAAAVRPRAAIHPDATAVHGLSMGDLADAPSFPEIWPQLRAVLHGHTLVAYDAKFDRRMLDQTSWRYGLTPPQFRWRCAKNLYAQFWGEPLLPHGYQSQRLAVACRRLGISLDKSRAADRCRATLALLRAIAGDGSEQPK